jgi:N-acetylmuramic acid 6-phosphate etherase
VDKVEQNKSRGHLLTEQINPNSQNLDQMTALELVDLFNSEDQKTIAAIASAREELAAAIDITSEAFQKGGRLFYIGAGTSGRLGVLDASECPPTFCTPPELVQGIIAGGAGALVRSSEALEDRPEDGRQAIAHHHITNLDIVIGITAGGTTPYVRGALAAAKERGAKTVAISCVPADQVPFDVNIDIRLLTGPEILAGSTRLKAGTVTKMALNIISTSAMVKFGKVYGNRMIDVSVTNEKLHDRAVRILQDLTDLSREEADILLEKAQRQVKVALLMHWKNIEFTEAKQLLQETQDNLRKALEIH